MADEIEFPNGLIVKAPRDGAPDFVKAAISIKIADLSAWLAGREGEWVNLDVKESKGGKWYCSVNTYKPKQETKPGANVPAGEYASGGVPPNFDDDIPFAPIGRGICGHVT